MFFHNVSESERRFLHNHASVIKISVAICIIHRRTNQQLSPVEFSNTLLNKQSVKNNSDNANVHPCALCAFILDAWHGFLRAHQELKQCISQKGSVNRKTNGVAHEDMKPRANAGQNDDSAASVENTLPSAETRMRCENILYNPSSSLGTMRQLHDTCTMANEADTYIERD